MANPGARTIAIDPQGGGEKPIAGSRPQQVVAPNGLVDKDLLLTIALGIEEILEGRGLQVSMTRKSDRNLSKAKRAQVARDSAARLFLSLCFAGSDDPAEQGVGAIVHPDADEDSEHLADRLQRALANNLGHPPLGVERRNRAALRPDRLAEGMAACELAIANLSDPAEAERLEDPSYQRRIAETIAEVIWEIATAEGQVTEVSAMPALSEAPASAENLPGEWDTPTIILQNGKDLDMATIVIDPGHGGTTNLDCSSWNNAKGPVIGTLEKDLTLDVALRLDQELRDRGYSDVTMTRTSDMNVSGRDRALFAKRLNADVLLSIHFNGSTDHNAQGTETFIHRRRSKTGPSAQLCRAVQSAVLRATGLRDRNALHPPHFVKTAGFCVLNPNDHARDTAAVLTEISFLDRANEERRLQRESYRDEIAFALAEGIEAYLTPDADASFDDEHVEDAFALAGAEAMAEGPAYGAEETRAEGIARERGGHEIAGAAPALSRGADASVRDIARALSAPVVGAEVDADERSEAEHLDGADAPDFSGFGQDQDADAETIGRLFGSDMAALMRFDHPAFADFVRGLNLRYFQPIELLWLGGQHNRPGDRCEGLNELPPRSLWPRIGSTIQMLDEIRHILGGPVRILSAYRNNAYNVCVRGKSGSLHKQFNALDWTSTVGNVAQWHAIAKQVRASDPKYLGGIGDYPSQNFVHIDTRGYQADF